VTLFISILLSVLLGYLALELAFYWAALAAYFLHRRRARGAAAKAAPNAGTPYFCILTACRDGAACIPGLVKSFRDQDYPPGRFRLFLIADDCLDDSAAVARSLGMEVYERPHPAYPGKGNALNELLLSRRLQEEPFDALVVLDIDARVGPSFLRQAAAYFSNGPVVLSCATFAKNPDETLFTRVGTLIQALLRFHQEGRAALGKNAILYGSHGYALSREAVERLEWRTTTGLIAEDMELRLRATLRSIPILYAPELSVFNEVTADARSVREQRRRWNATYPPIVSRYAGKLLRRGLFDALFGVLLLPAFANLFLILLVLSVVLAALGWQEAFLRPFAAAAAVLWAADAAYFFAAFSLMGVSIGRRELRGFAAHLAMRALALIEGIFFVRVKNWAPAPHEKDP